jgi:hypothetical protein
VTSGSYFVDNFDARDARSRQVTKRALGLLVVGRQPRLRVFARYPSNPTQTNASPGTNQRLGSSCVAALPRLQFVVVLGSSRSSMRPIFLMAAMARSLD